VVVVTGDLQVRFGKRLREHRVERGLTQEQFGEEVGYHRTHVGKLERGKCNVTLQTLEDIAERIGVDPRSLLRRTGSATDESVA
jgi:transcriptional regulator with XRE-family HTH domain